MPTENLKKSILCQITYDWIVAILWNFIILQKKNDVVGQNLNRIQINFAEKE